MSNLKKKFDKMIWTLFYLERYIICYGGDVSMYNSKRKFKYMYFMNFILFLWLLGVNERLLVCLFV